MQLWRGGLVLLLVVVVVGASPAAGQEAEEPPHVPIVDLLPPLADDDPAADRAAVCGADGLTCVGLVERQLAEWEAYFGCDHRAVFPTVYRLLTREIRLQLEADPGFFDDPAGLGWESVQFYELYEQMITAHLAGEPIPDAWQVVMEMALEGDWTGGHDMLAAINAHVQRDMPFAVAETGITTPDGTSRKADHDRFNQVLNRAYDSIVRAVGERYDPFMTSIAEVPIVDDVGSMQLVAGWREGVWRNAEALVSAEGTPLYDVVVTEIETNARTWAELIATGEVPGRRALRDAHCEAYLAGLEADPDPADGVTDPGGDPDQPTGPVGEATTDPTRVAEGDAEASVTTDVPLLPSTGGGAGILAMVLAACVAHRGGSSPTG